MSGLSPREKAELVLSVNTNSIDRPLEPLEAADKIKVLVEELGSADRAAAALRLKRSDMIHRFLSLLCLPETVKPLIGWRGPQEGKLSLDMAYRISTLETDEEKDVLAKAIVEANLDKPVKKNDVLDVVTLHRRNPKMSILDCFEKVLSLRPVIDVGYVLVFQLTDEDRNELTRIDRDFGKGIDTILREALELAVPPSEVRAARVKGEFVSIGLSESGYKEFKTWMNEREIRSRDAVTQLIKNRFMLR